MDPQDYSTWTSFADHPIFADRERWLARSVDPEMYDGIRDDSEFLVEWYLHSLPQPPVEEQAEAAKLDLANLKGICSDLERSFGSIVHELFILDDFTVFVSVAVGSLRMEVYPSQDEVLLNVLEPMELEIVIHDIADVIPELQRIVET